MSKIVMKFENLKKKKIKKKLQKILIFCYQNHKKTQKNSKIYKLVKKSKNLEKRKTFQTMNF